MFSLEISANWMLAAKFIQFKTPVNKSNFQIYTHYGDTSKYKGLPAIPTVGPSLEKLGEAMAKNSFISGKRELMQKP